MWVHLAVIWRSNQGRKLLIANFSDDAFPHRPPCAVDRNLDLICVAEACLANLFLNVRPQTEVEGCKPGDCGDQNLDHKLTLAS